MSEWGASVAAFEAAPVDCALSSLHSRSEVDESSREPWMVPYGSAEGLETDVMRRRVRDALLLSDEPEAPRRLGRYDVLGSIGRGGMGVVYRARDAELDRIVALKVLRDDRDRDDERLLLEARALAKLSHPNVLTVFEVGVEAEVTFLALEYIDGPNLQRWVQDSSPPLERRIELLVQVADGLAAAHAEGFVHCDVKPSNILVGSDGRARVADFGLARGSEGPSMHPGDAAGVGDPRTPGQGGSKTGRGRPGTLGFMAPEQMLDEPATAKSDQFSFFVTLVAVIAERVPFGYDRACDVLSRITGGQPQGLDSLPAALVPAVRRGLRADPAERFGSMAVVAATLRAIQARPTRRRRLMMLVGAALVPTAFAAWQGATAPQRCGDARERLAQSWSTERRAAVQTAFEASGLPFADASGQRVVQIADAYATTWVQTYDDACAATWTRGEQSQQLLDLRMSCLDRGRAALARVTMTLASGELDALRKGVELAESMPELSTCSDAQTLRRLATRRSPRHSEATHEARLLFDEGDLALDLGRFDEAEASYERARHAVEEHELPGVVSRAESKMAQVRLQQGRFEGASQRVDEALRWAAAGSDGDAAALAHLQRSRVDLRKPDPEAARFQLDLAAASLLRGDSPRVREAELALIRSELEMSTGDAVEALRELDLAGELFEQTLGPNVQALTPVLTGKGFALAAAGRQDEALPLFMEAANNVARAYGEAHPGQARALVGAAHVHQTRGDIDEALRLHRRAFELLQADPGYEPQQRARVCLLVADDYGRLANFDEALAWMDRAEALFVEVLGPEHPDTGLVDFSRASFKLDQMQDFGGAARDWRSVLERWEGVETRQRTSAIARLNLAISESRAGQHERAVASATRARTELSTFVQPDGQQMIGYLSSLGDVYRLAGEHGTAKEAYEKALEISSAHGGGGFLIDEARFGLARILAAEGDRARAAELLATARDNFVRDGEGKHGVLVELDAWRREHLPDVTRSPGLRGKVGR